MKAKGFLNRMSGFITALFVLPVFRIWRRKQKLECDEYLDEQLARQRAEVERSQRYL